MTEAEPRPSPSCLKPFLSIACISMPITFIAGSMFGQSAGMLPQLRDPDSLLHVTSEEATWIASIPTIGIIIASCAGGTLSDTFGRVRAFQLGYFCFGLGFGLMAGADRIMVLLLGRFFIGLGMGVSFPALVHVSELAPTAHRSILLSLTPLMSSFGLVYIYIVGGYLPWYIASLLTCVLSIIGLCLTFLCDESPTWLVRKDKLEEARKSLERIEPSANLEAKLKELQDIAASQNQAEPVSMATFLEPIVWKPFLTVITLSVLQNVCGFYIIIYYTVDFMKEFHTTFDPLEVTILIGVMRLISTIISCFLMGRMYRRTIGAVSAFSSAVLLFLIFGYLHFEKTNPYLSENSWISVGLFLVFIVTMNVGIYPLPWILPQEVFPNKVRGAMCGASFAAMSAVMFGSVKLYYVLVDNLGLKGLILMFAVGSMLFGIFSITLLVETHKKTLDEIELEFSGTKIKKKEIKDLASTG